MKYPSRPFQIKSSWVLDDKNWRDRCRDGTGTTVWLDTLNSTKNNLILLDLLMILLRNPGLHPSFVTQVKLCMYNVHMYIGLTSTQTTYTAKKIREMLIYLLVVYQTSRLIILLFPYLKHFCICYCKVIW